jgi:acyl carrier protein
MVDHESMGSADESPSSSTRPRDVQTIQRICGVLKARFNVAGNDVYLDSRFVEDLGIDIFDLPDLVLALEAAFEVDISLSAAARILTVRDAVMCVTRG